MIRLWLCAVVIIGSLMGVAGSHARDEPFDAGPHWAGLASLDDSSGALRWCVISATYRSGITIVFGYRADLSLIMLLSNPSWALTKGSEFPVRLAVDQRWSRSMSAVAHHETGVAIELGGDTQAQDALRYGQQLTVHAARETFEFLLTGTAVGLASAAQCVISRMASSGGSDPFSVNGNPFGQGQPSGDASRSEQLSGAQLIAFLTAAGLRDASLMTDADRARYMPYAQHAWITRNTIGAFAAFSLAGRSLDEVIADEIAIISRSCQGRFANRKGWQERLESATMVHFATACDSSNTRWVTAGTIIVGGTDALLIEHAGADTAAVQNADEMVAKALRGLYR